MRRFLLFTTIVAMSMAMAMPAHAQSRKDKKAAEKAAWEARQQFIKDSTARANQAKLDAMDREAAAQAEQAAREEAARREQAARDEASRREQAAADQAKQEAADKEAALQEKPREELCSSNDWPSTETMLRGRGVADELDQQNSIDDARQAAIKELASEISTKVQDLVSRNRKSVKKNNNRSSLVAVDAKTVTEVEETTGFRKACSETVEFYENGVRVFKTYYVVEIPADKVLKNVYNGLQEDEDLKLDMNFDEFKQEFNQRFLAE